MTTNTRSRARSLPSTTTKLNTEFGSLYVTVSVDESGQPFEVFGFIGKGGSFQHGVAELVCRLISLHLRRGTPVEEIIDQCQGIAEMQPFANVLPDGTSVAVLGLGDGIAHILKTHPASSPVLDSVRGTPQALKVGEWSRAESLEMKRAA